MIKYILKSGDLFLHFEMGGIVEWHNINPSYLCAFDSKKEAQEIIDEYSLDGVSVVEEHFAENFFD